MKKILGMGNAIVDILTLVENDSVLEKLQLPKGSMQLIDAAFIETMQKELNGLDRYMATGGSAANTISGLAKLGVKSGYVGKIGHDEAGTFFQTDSEGAGIKTHLQYSDNTSGQCMVLVSPDGERTMCTFLGAACELTGDDLNVNMFYGYDYFHIEGYLVQNHDLIRRAVKLAKESGLKVSIDLASYNVVEANLDFLKEIIHKYVDIVFANEEEAHALTGLPADKAVVEIAKDCEIAVVKIGKDGSYILSENKLQKVDAIKATCIDTTGAGDLFASGFLFGLTQSLPLDVCGKIGSIVSGNVVEVVGAKMDEERWDSIKTEIHKLV
jgi:sugar/nucleoside kinase (ribokinase family)